MCSCKADVGQRLVGVFNDRRTLIRSDRCDQLDTARDQLRHIDDDLMRLLFSEIRKLIQHFLCSVQIKRRLVFTVCHTVSHLDDPAKHFILRIKKMNVSCRAHRFVQFFSKRNDSLIDITEVVERPDISTALIIDQVRVVADRLNLQIIVPGRDLFDFLLTQILGNGSVKLSR